MEEQASYDTSFTAAERRRLLAAVRTIGGAVGPTPGSPPSPSAVIAEACVEEALVQFGARREATTEGFTESDLRVLALALLHQAEHLTIGCDECAPRAQVDKIVTLAQRVPQLAALYRTEQRLLLQDDEQ